MPETVKLTDEEMSKLALFQRRFDVVTKQYGEMAFRGVILQKQLDEHQKEMLLAQQTMREIEDERLAHIQLLQEKYGRGSINLETGEFSSDEETPKQETTK